MRVLHALTLTVAATLVAACGGHGAPELPPTDPTIGNGAGSSPPPAATRAMFNVSQGVLPYPTDLYFAGSTDGTLRLPDIEPFTPNVSSLNQLDGFSTTAPITVRFSGPIDPKTLSAADIVVVRLTLDNATKAPIVPPTPGAELPKPLVYGVDYTAYVVGTGGASAFAYAQDTAGTVLAIQPTHPLDPSSGATNVGYLVLLTNGITDAAGSAVVADNDYATVRNGALADLASGATTPTCASVTDPTLNAVCQLTFGHLAIGAALKLVDPASVIVSFSFTTESVYDTLNILWATYQQTPVAPGTIAVAPTGQTTKEFLAAVGAQSPGLADVWVGKLTLPFYLTASTGPNDPTVLNSHWTAAGPSMVPGIDSNSRNLTRFNPVPAKTADIAVPIIVGVPDAARTGCVEPAAGWPVVVFQHGITGNRSQALATFDGYASKCFVVVAKDLVLHGITDPKNPLYRNQLFAKAAPALMTGERTFDLDLMNNTTLAAGPDGVTDASGSHYINLTSLLSSRDYLRQDESDLLWLAHVLPTLSLGANMNGKSDVDGTQLQFAALSLGSMVGIAPLSVVDLATGKPNSPYNSGLLSTVGGAAVYLLRDSPSFAPPINAGLKLASGGVLVPGASAYDNWLRDAQQMVDAGDPVNYVGAAAAFRPLLIQQVVGGGLLPNGAAALPDQVIPNTATQRLLDAANFKRFGPGQALLAPGTAAYVNFIYGQHGSILTPAGDANTGQTNAAAFLEAQTEAVAFAVAHGLAVTVGAGSPAVIQP